MGLVTDLAGFFTQRNTGPAGPQPSGNVAWAIQLADELKAVVRQDSADAPRSQQVELGPSEVGHPCQRQIAGKRAGLPRTNHVVDPWPSWVGTGLHAHIDRALQASGNPRWISENRVCPDVTLCGTADLFDLHTGTVIDHKFLGATALDKIKRKGAGDTYRKQTLLYARGYKRLGLPVRRVMLMLWPRTGSSLSMAYAYGIDLTSETEAETDDLLFNLIPQQLEYADQLRKGQVQLHDIPASPDSDNCYFCPFFRPEENQTATTCRGHVGNTER